MPFNIDSQGRFILDGNGRFFNDSSCCCGGVPVTCSDCGAGACSDCYEIVATGFTGAYTWVNGTWVVDETLYGPCYWGRSDGRAEMYPDAGFWIYQIFSADFVTTIRFEADFHPDCLPTTPCPDEIDGVPVDASVTPNPDYGTISINPVSCPVTACDLCAPALPTEYTVTITNATSLAPTFAFIDAGGGVHTLTENGSCVWRKTFIDPNGDGLTWYIDLANGVYGPNEWTIEMYDEFYNDYWVMVWSEHPDGLLCTGPIGGPYDDTANPYAYVS